MSLKRSYATEADVPPERKADYVPKGGRYVLDVEGFDNIESVLAKNTELVGKVNGHAAELATKDGEISRLTGELATARTAPTLPRGHKAVPNADAELLEVVKAEGLDTAEKVKTLKTEHGQFKTEAESAKAAKHAAEVFGAMGWDKEKAALHVPKYYDLSTVTLKDGEGGKKVPMAKVKQADDTFIEKPFADVVKATPELLDLAPLLAGTSGGTRVPGSTGGGGSPAGQKDVVSDFIKERDAAAAARPNPFTKPAPAATA